MTTWQRRERSFDPAAVIVLVLARLLLEIDAGSGTVLAFFATAIVLMLGYRDRALVREGTGLRPVCSTWLFRRWDEKRELLSPTEVVLSAQRTWSGSRLSLSARDGMFEIERWRESSQRPNAEAAGRSLARALDLPLRDESTGAVFRPDPREQARRLMHAIAAIPPAAMPSQSRARLEREGERSLVMRGQLALHMRLWGAWLTIVGSLMLFSSSSVFADLQLYFDLLRWALGSILFCQGVRSLWPGEIAVRIEPDGLRVERAGLARDLLLQLSFAELTGLVIEPRTSRTKPATLRLELDGFALWLTPTDMGLREREFPWFCCVLSDVIQKWCCARTGEHVAIGEPPLPTPLVTLSALQRGSPATPLGWLAARFPRTAYLFGFAFLLQTFALRHELGGWLDHAPSYLMVETPHLLGWLAEGLLMLAAALVPGALVYACLLIVLSAPNVRGIMGMVFFFLFVPSTVPLVNGLISGVLLFERANLCLGAHEQPVQAQLIAADVMRFTRDGESIDYQAPNRRGVKQMRTMDELRPNLDSLVEIRGFLGGRYITATGARATACDPPAQLAKLCARLAWN